MNDKSLYIISFTDAGGVLAERIRQTLISGDVGWRVRAESGRGKGRLSEWTRENFRTGNALLFIGACGIAVRAIAPYVASKKTDPAVLVMDERGRYVIPLLSGHIGEANSCALRIAEITGGEAVLTTATDVNRLFAIDVFASRNDLVISDMTLAKEFSAKLLKERRGVVFRPIGFEEDIAFNGRVPEELEIREFCGGSPVSFDGIGRGTDSQMFSGRHEKGTDSQTFSGRHEKGTDSQTFGGRHEKGTDSQIFSESLGEAVDSDEGIGIPCCLVSPDTPRTEMEKTMLYLVPRCLVLGIGCRKGKDYKDIFDFVSMKMEEQHLRLEAVMAIASIDIKKDEEGLIRLSERLAVPFITFSAEELAAQAGDFAESDFVASKVGVPNVCERAAMAAMRVIGEKSRSGANEADAKFEVEANEVDAMLGVGANEVDAKSGVGAKGQIAENTAGSGRLLMKKCSENGMTLSIGIARQVLGFDSY